MKRGRREQRESRIWRMRGASEKGKAAAAAARSEAVVFADLAKLCASPGFAHAIASLCLRDNYVRFKREMTADDTQHLFSANRLVRTEINTLIGLCVKGPMDATFPSPETVARY